jgi:pyruvate formate lyase activating enzyme
MIVNILGTTLVDYPGRVASTIFIAGCNLRCPFCHNEELVLPEKYKTATEITIKETLAFLQKRKGFITGVVFTGGEPLLFPPLLELSDRVRELGLKSKLDTNGSLPHKLLKAVDHFDYVAMDIKSPPDKYIMATGGRSDFTPISESIAIIMENCNDYEFRTTVVPTLVSSTDDFVAICNEIPGAKRYAIQPFYSEKTLSSEMQNMAILTPIQIKQMSDPLKSMVKELIIR